MNIRIKQSNLSIDAIAPKSKSITHRLMIAYALSNGKACDMAYALCDDTICTNVALNSLMCAQKDMVIDVRESGSTLRMLLPIACALDKRVKFVGSDKITTRPIKELVDVLRDNGANIDGDTLPLSVSGGLRSGTFEISGEISSQYISGLLFALPLLNCDSVIKIKGEMRSSRYVDMTLDALNRAGVKIDRADNKTYCVRGNQKYNLYNIKDVEGDWSSSAFLLVAGALLGSARVSGLNFDSNQADIKILKVLEDMGANVIKCKDCVHVRKSPLQAIDIDVDESIDLAPIISVLCACANGVSRIYGIERLRLKESDRLNGIIDMLNAFSIDCSLKGDHIEIVGGTPMGGKWQSKDHRMVMSGVIMALNAIGESEIGDIDCIDKSYPQFIKDMAIEVEYV